MLCVLHRCCRCSAWRHPVWSGPAPERADQPAVRQPRQPVPWQLRQPADARRGFPGECSESLCISALRATCLHPFHAPAAHRQHHSMLLLQWYDTRTMTIIADTTFVNYKYQPQLGFNRPQVFYVSGGAACRGCCCRHRCTAAFAMSPLSFKPQLTSYVASALPCPALQSMTYSDEYKPQQMSATRNITLLNCDHEAIARDDLKFTGAARGAGRCGVGRCSAAVGVAAERESRMSRRRMRCGGCELRDSSLRQCCCCCCCRCSRHRRQLPYVQLAGHGWHRHAAGRAHGHPGHRRRLALLVAAVVQLRLRGAAVTLPAGSLRHDCRCLLAAGCCSPGQSRRSPADVRRGVWCVGVLCFLTPHPLHPSLHCCPRCLPAAHVERLGVPGAARAGGGTRGAAHPRGDQAVGHM